MREEKTEEEEGLKGGCGLTCHTREASRPLLIPASLSLSLSSRSLLPTTAWRKGGRERGWKVCMHVCVCMHGCVCAVYEHTRLELRG